MMTHWEGRVWRRIVEGGKTVYYYRRQIPFFDNRDGSKRYKDFSR